MDLHGLSTAAAAEYQSTYGYNELTEERESLFHKLLRRAFSPISGMLLLASLLSYGTGKTFDGSFILILLVINIVIAVWQEHKADRAIEELNAHLATVVSVLRDGAWAQLNARLLVPHDIVHLKSGNIVPADCTLLEASTVTANEAALTGESLPKDKALGDPLYSGSFLASGLATVEVTAIGQQTSFGKTVSKIDTTPKKSALERDILRISTFLSIISMGAVVVLTLLLLREHTPLLDLLRLDLSLIIAGIPISLPTVMTLIIAFGILALAKRSVIIRRLSALEELANTDLLLTDKTGTLTKNHIAVGDRIPYEGSAEDLSRWGALLGTQEPDNAMYQALMEHALPPKIPTLHYIPGDSTRKHSTLLIDDRGHFTLSLGAPQVISSLCSFKEGLRERFDQDVERLAARGFRTLALARASGEEEKNMSLLGLFALSDELREDAPDTIEFLKNNGIQVVMVTGDNQAIAKEVAHTLHLEGTVTPRSALVNTWNTVNAQTYADAGAFAEILPEDKLELVTRAKAFYTVAANGDGVNDLPAVKAASVGFAVNTAVDALKVAADIVLLSDGIGVMRDAFIEGRKIFERLYSYSLYRISESFRLILTILLLGFLTGTYPLSPLQLILLALLNDIPIISLAFDRVEIAPKPSKINVKRQFSQSLRYGTVGICNSMILYFLAIGPLHQPLPIVETLFFLKLTVSGHLLIYVAHTRRRWWRYLPSKEVIGATSITQGIATFLAITGFLMPAALPWPLAILVWIWSFLFMQLSEVVKRVPAVA